MEPAKIVEESFGRVDVRLRAGRLGFREVGLVARRIAELQVEAGADPQHGDPAVLGRNVVEPLSILDAHMRPEQLAEVEHRLLAMLGENAGWFCARARRGRVVRGFGDLRLEHVYVDDRGTVRIDGDDALADRFRCADAIADVAMLATDLDHFGRSDLAEHLVASWAETAGDYDAYRGLSFYTRYRAYLRAKREAIVAADPSRSVVQRDVAGGKARRLLVHALAPDRQPLFAARVIAVGGMMASGKSTLAAALAERLGAPRVSTDRTRKQMLGVEPSACRAKPDAWRRSLAEDLTEAVYDQMLRRGDAVLRSGRPVVLDATFRTAAFRAGARQLAERNAVPFVYIECATPPHLGRQRLRERERQAMFGDGRLEIFDDFVAGYEPPHELTDAEHVYVDTAQPFEQSLSDLLATVPTWP